MPSVPGLVSEIVVPSKSEICSLPARARVTMSSEAARNCAKLSACAFFTLGTRREREPSDFVTSTARPKRISPRRTRTGSPEAASNASFMTGKASIPRMMAHEIRWVNEILDCPIDARASLMRRRFSSSSLIGI